MSNQQTAKRNKRILRHGRVRKQIASRAGRARLNVFRSLSHIYAQVIDDESGKTLAQASSREGLRPKRPKPES